MGNPRQFSREVPKRARELLTNLYDDVPSSQDSGLKLKATFLLAISMPIITLPYERIARAKAHLGEEVHDDEFTKVVKAEILSENEVGRAAYFSGEWKYHFLDRGAAFPQLALSGLPQEVQAQLDTEEASEAAKAITSKLFCSIVRNALSHGSVLYLGAGGQSGEHLPIRQFAFIGTNRSHNPTGLHILRTTMAGYREFLLSWVDWLQSAGIDDAQDLVPASEEEQESGPSDEQDDAAQADPAVGVPTSGP